MGVSVSHPLRRSPKVKYIQTDGEWSAFDETEQFLSQSSQEENTKGETLRASKGSSKRNQFKGVRGNSRCPFDSLDTIDWRKSVPFAVLPENNNASTSSPDSKVGFTSIQSDGETILAEKTGKVLFLEEADDNLEGECSAQKFAGKLKEKNRSSPAEYVQRKVIPPLQGKLVRKDRVSSSTGSGEDVHLPEGNHGDSTRTDLERANGRENERESELEKTRMVLADSETEMVRPSYRYKLGPRHSTSEKFS